MSLDTQQQAALENLRDLLTEEETGLVKVYIDRADSYPEKPCLVIGDEEGMLETRFGGSRREVQWPLRLQVFIERQDLEEGHSLARSIRARLIDRLGDDLQLGPHLGRPAAVTNTLWRDPLRIVQEEEGGPDYITIEGVYILVFRDARTFS